jgi:hypothetical protein
MVCTRKYVTSIYIPYTSTQDSTIHLVRTYERTNEGTRKHGSNGGWLFRRVVHNGDMDTSREGWETVAAIGSLGP